jgi:hypothetical protein
LTSKHEFEHDVKLDVEARVREGVKAVLEEVLKEEMTEHLKAGYREFALALARIEGVWMGRNFSSSEI